MKIFGWSNAVGDLRKALSDYHSAGDNSTIKRKAIEAIGKATEKLGQSRLTVLGRKWHYKTLSELEKANEDHPVVNIAKVRFGAKKDAHILFENMLKNPGKFTPEQFESAASRFSPAQVFQKLDAHIQEKKREHARKAFDREMKAGNVRGGIPIHQETIDSDRESFITEVSLEKIVVPLLKGMNGMLTTDLANHFIDLFKNDTKEDPKILFPAKVALLRHFSKGTLQSKKEEISTFLKNDADPAATDSDTLIEAAIAAKNKNATLQYVLGSKILVLNTLEVVRRNLDTILDVAPKSKREEIIRFFGNFPCTDKKGEVIKMVLDGPSDKVSIDEYDRFVTMTPKQAISVIERALDFNSHTIEAFFSHIKGTLSSQNKNMFYTLILDKLNLAGPQNIDQEALYQLKTVLFREAKRIDSLGSNPEDYEDVSVPEIAHVPFTDESIYLKDGGIEATKDDFEKVLQKDEVIENPQEIDLGALFDLEPGEVERRKNVLAQGFEKIRDDILSEGTDPLEKLNRARTKLESYLAVAPKEEAKRLIAFFANATVSTKYPNEEITRTEMFLPKGHLKYFEVNTPYTPDELMEMSYLTLEMALELIENYLPTGDTLKDFLNSCNHMTPSEKEKVLTALRNKK